MTNTYQWYTQVTKSFFSSRSLWFYAFYTYLFSLRSSYWGYQQRIELEMGSIYYALYYWYCLGGSIS